MLKPERLETGDMICIIAPSGNMGSRFPHRIDLAVANLKKMGFAVVEGANTRRSRDWASASAKERAEELHAAFSNPKIKAIVCSIGGTVASQILEYLDFTLIKNNPKIFCGYSDISVIHYALLKETKMVSFYGPCAMTQFGEYPSPFRYTVDFFLKAISVGNPMGQIPPSIEWTDELLDWGKKLDLTRQRHTKPNKGYVWLRPGKVTGRIIGGCLSSIIRLAGTQYWPVHKNKILFLEIPEGQSVGKGEPLAYVDAYLTMLDQLGVFKDIKGLVFGRPVFYSEEQETKLGQLLLERTKRYSFPILFGADIGHTDPMITIPLNTRVTLDSKTNSFSFDESGVK